MARAPVITWGVHLSSLLGAHFPSRSTEEHCKSAHPEQLFKRHNIRHSVDTTSRQSGYGR